MCNNQHNGQFGGFYELYAINVRKPNNDSGSHTKVKGLNSPFGRRGAICQNFGWTWDYLLHGIAWAVVQRIMCDLPSYDSENDDDVVLTEDNADTIMNFINNMM